MKAMIRFFIQHPTLVNLFVFLLVGIGGLKLIQTQSTNFPSQKVRFIDISVPYPGASPTEVEDGITDKIEDNLEGVDGIERVTSSSRENLAIISVELEEYADANVLLVEVRNAVDRINNFPGGVEPASIEKREPMDITMSLALAGDLSLQNMKDFGEDIREDLMALPGISRVFVEGVPDEEIEVRIRENDLRTYGITFEQVQLAIRSANLETFGGSIESPTEVISIKADNKGEYGKDLRHIVVRANPDGSMVHLEDVAEIVDQFKDQPNARYFQGKQVVVVNVYTLTSEDILENAEAVRAYLTDFNATHAGVELQILEDGTLNLNNRLSTMVNSGVAGIILVLLVLALFLDRYLAFWVALKIPVAIIAMFTVVDLYGMTINVVSLFGFILVLGILVDDGVVIGENIYRHAKEKGKSPGKAALDGTLEMVVPVLISIATTAVAFSLFFFLPTQAGEFFGEMGFVVIAVLFFALIESFFVLPAHLSHSRGLKKDVRLTRIEKWATGVMNGLRDRLYVPPFTRAIQGKVWVRTLTLIGFVAALAGTIRLVSSGVVNFTFFPNLDDDAFFIEVELPPGTPVAVTEERLRQIEEATWKVNEHYSAERKDGRDIVLFVEQITGPLDNQGKLKVTFMNGEERGISSFRLSQDIREQSPPIPEATRLIYGLGATAAVFGLPVSISLRGNDLGELRKAKDDLKARMMVHPDLKDVSDNDMEGIREYRVRLKPEGELMGLNLAQVMNQIRSGFFGVEAQSLQRNSDEVEVWLRYPQEGRSSIDQLLDMQVYSPAGSAYKLKDVAYIEEGTGTLTINHIEGQREIGIEANVANISASAPKVIADIEATILPEILDAYPSVMYSVEGQNRMSFKLIGAITSIGPIILLFILALIVMNCNSFSQGFLVFSLFPFALTGVIIGHWVHGTPLSIFSLIGTIALIGVFVNNTLVFLSTFNDLMREGFTFQEALLETARSRFRPIVLTTITTVAGLAPLIVSNSLGAQFLKGPAIAMAYGLTFGILNVLVLLPLFLMGFNHWRQIAYRLLGERTITPELAEPAVRKLKYIIEE